MDRLTDRVARSTQRGRLAQKIAELQKLISFLDAETA